MSRIKQKTRTKRASEFYFIQDQSSPYLEKHIAKGEIIDPKNQNLKGKFVFLENKCNNSLYKQAFGTLIALPITTSKSTKNANNLYELGYIQHYDPDDLEYATIIIFKRPIQNIPLNEELISNHLSISMIHNYSNRLTSALLLNCVTKSTSLERPSFLSTEYDDMISKHHHGYIYSENGPDNVIFSQKLYHKLSIATVTLQFEKLHSYTRKEKVNRETKRNNTTNDMTSNKSKFVKRRKTVENRSSHKQHFHLPNIKHTFYVVHDATKESLFNSTIPQEIKTSLKNTIPQNQFSSFEDVSTISNTEQSHHKISKTHYAMPFLLSIGKFGMITYEEYLENFFIRTNSKENITMTPELHDEILWRICHKQSLIIQYDTVIDTNDYPNGFKFRAVTDSDFKMLIKKGIIRTHKITSTDIDRRRYNNIVKHASIAYTEESQYVHNPFPKSKDQIQKLYYPGVVVSQWVVCENFNKRNITIGDVKQLLNTYSNCGNLSWNNPKSKGFILNIGSGSGSTVSSSSPFAKLEHVKHSKSKRKNDPPLGLATWQKKSFLMAKDQAKFSKTCDHLVSDLLYKCINNSNNTQDDTQRMNLSPHENKMRVINCGNKFTLGFFDTKQKNTRDVKFTDESTIMSYVLSQSYQDPDELTCANSYISNFFSMFGGIGAPQTVSYLFIDEIQRSITNKKNSQKKIDPEFHVYFFLESYNIVVRVNHGASQIFHAYTFNHRTAIPCCVIDNCVYYQHDELNVFSQGVAGYV